MSDPKLQRADGCSIFATLIVAGILISSFYFVQGLFQQDKPAPVSDETSKKRLEVIELHKTESGQFKGMVDSIHSQNNSSLEAVMQNGLKEDYGSKNSTAP